MGSSEDPSLVNNVDELGLVYYGLTSTLELGGWSAPRTARITSGKRPGTHCKGCWVGPRDVLDGCGKFPPHWDLILGPSST